MAVAAAADAFLTYAEHAGFGDEGDGATYEDIVGLAADLREALKPVESPLDERSPSGDGDG